MTKEEVNISKVDIGVAVTKSLVGAIPWAGPAISEIISNTIPNQRLDRVANFIKELDKRLTEVERESLKENKYFIDLFEDAIIQAARALTEDRNKYIAVFLSNNKSVDELSLIGHPV